MQEVGNVASMVSLVVHDMKQHLAPGHGTSAAIHESELQDVVMRCLTQVIGVVHVPSVESCLIGHQ
jgi:hypothetical protein